MSGSSPATEKQEPKARFRLGCGGLGFLAVVGIVLGIVICENGLETCRSRYLGRAEAEADSAIERGWIPPFLPGSARDIREVHNLDLNWVIGRFGFAQDDLAEMVASVEEIASSEVALPSRWLARQMDEWPTDLTQGKEPRGFRFFRYPLYEDRMAILAVHPSREEAFFWCP
jgi:hypothetical protein